MLLYINDETQQQQGLRLKYINAGKYKNNCIINNKRNNFLRGSILITFKNDVSFTDKIFVTN